MRFNVINCPGWIPGVATVLFMAWLTTYTGLMMHETFMMRPSLRSYVDLLSYLHGSRGRRYAVGTVYTLIFLIVASGLVVNAATWFELFPNTCRAAWAPLAAAILLAIGQVQSMHKLSYVSLFAFSMIFIPLIVILAELPALARTYTPGKTAMFGNNIRDAVVAVTDIYFVRALQQAY